MKPAPTLPSAEEPRTADRDGAFERLESRFGSGDPFGPLDSDDIEWLQHQETQRAARETRRCTFCGTRLHPISPYAEDCPSIGRHQERCRKASPAERAFYRDHRRWPRAGQVDAAEEEAA
jgi:hypothetical protein